MTFRKSRLCQIFNKADQLIFRSTMSFWHRLIYQVLKLAEEQGLIDDITSAIIFSQFDPKLKLLNFDEHGRVTCEFEEIKEIIYVVGDVDTTGEYDA